MKNVFTSRRAGLPAESIDNPPGKVVKTAFR